MTLGLFRANADNVQFTVMVSDPDALEATLNWAPYTLEKGANKMDLALNSNFSVRPKEGYVLTKVTDQNGTAPSGFYSNQWYAYVDKEMQDKVYTLTVVAIADLRTAEYTINVDDPLKVTVKMDGYDRDYLKLEAGSNVIKFDPEVEKFISIKNVEYGKPVYSVKKNGATCVFDGYEYSISLEEDCVIDIVTELPDEEVSVTFNYSEGAAGSIKSVLVNGDEIEDWDGVSLVVKCGDKVSFYGDAMIYSYETVKVNDKEISFYGYGDFYAMEDTEVYVDAHPYGNVKGTIKVNRPDLIDVKVTYDRTLLELKEGENEIELPEKDNLVAWEVKPEGVIKKAELNGEPVTWSVNLKEGDVLEFVVEEKVFDMSAVLWIDNPKSAACAGYTNMSSDNDRSVRYDFSTPGYYTFPFYDGCNPFSISWTYSYSEAAPEYRGRVYLNDERVISKYGEDSTYFELNLENNDVVKFFMDAVPEECDVKINIAEGVDPVVVKDIVTVVEDPAAGFTCFNGTQVVISGTGLKVKVNDKDLDPDPTEEGEEEEVALYAEGIPSYTFVVEENTTVEVTSDSEAGINSISGVKGADSDVFNSLGVKVGKKSDLKNLAPGIYIVKGKKVAVTK